MLAHLLTDVCNVKQYHYCYPRRSLCGVKQKQLSGRVLQKTWSETFRKIHMKTPVPEPLFRNISQHCY